MVLPRHLPHRVLRLDDPDRAERDDGDPRWRGRRSGRLVAGPRDRLRVRRRLPRGHDRVPPRPALRSRHRAPVLQAAEEPGPPRVGAPPARGAGRDAAGHGALRSRRPDRRHVHLGVDPSAVPALRRVHRVRHHRVGLLRRPPGLHRREGLRRQPRTRLRRRLRDRPRRHGGHRADPPCAPPWPPGDGRTRRRTGRRNGYRDDRRRADSVRRPNGRADDVSRSS